VGRNCGVSGVDLGELLRGMAYGQDIFGSAAFRPGQVLRDMRLSS